MAEQMFYGKPLTFNEKRHMYFLDGQHVPGVTTIISRLAKPALIQWAADMAVEHIRQNVHGPVTDAPWDELLETARKAHAAKRDAAGDIGTMLHTVAVHAERGEKTPWELVKDLPSTDQYIATRCALALNEWQSEQRRGKAEIERMVCSLQRRYAGRLDRFGIINNHLAVLDYKSGGDKIYYETWLQMAAYEDALREELGITEPIWHYAIHISKKTGEVTPYVRGPEHTAPAREAWRRLVELDAALRELPTDAKVRKAAA